MMTGIPIFLYCCCLPSVRLHMFTYIYEVMRIYPNLAQPLTTKAYQLITPPVLFINNDGVTYPQAGRGFNAL